MSKHSAITNFLSKECRQTKCGSSEIFGISYKRLVDTLAQRVRFVYAVMMVEQSDYINIWALFVRNECAEVCKKFTR